MNNKVIILHSFLVKERIRRVTGGPLCVGVAGPAPSTFLS